MRRRGCAVLRGSPKNQRQLRPPKGGRYKFKGFLGGATRLWRSAWLRNSCSSAGLWGGGRRRRRGAHARRPGGKRKRGGAGPRRGAVGSSKFFLVFGAP